MHNNYQQQGGELQVVEDEKRLLEEYGHEVTGLYVSNAQVRGVFRTIRAAVAVHYSLSAKRLASAALEHHRPDVVHVHNFFPLLTPSIYDACAEAAVPVVQTLHNFRTLCPGAMLLRDGKICEECLGGSPYRAAWYGCYRGSRLGSLSVARMVAYHRRRQTWQRKVARFIALTESSREKFVAAGFPRERMSVKPNFVRQGPLPRNDDTAEEGSYALFAGRLSAEKGVMTLLQAWGSLTFPLRIAGGGPLAAAVEGAGGPRVSLLGHLDRDRLRAEMKRALFVVAPSECHETFGMVVAEAFSLGVPAIVSGLGALAEIVQDGVTGLHVTPGDPADLARKVRWAVENPATMRLMGANARRVYEDKYTPERNYAQLVAIYESVL